ncbi:hypothetical protein [Nevskia sp.]|uniref:hypothetical protein n=1 Tax=Nevskia sp. TaxID=1929292 RepID=UPI0025E78F66|nr:hypothetical protein [Nevskia sp.]
MAKKFKVGELCIIVARAEVTDPNVRHHLGETVEVVEVSSLFRPIRSNGRKWDYIIASADGKRLVCLEPALAKRPPPNDAGSMELLTRITGWIPGKKAAERA